MSFNLKEFMAEEQRICSEPPGPERDQKMAALVQAALQDKAFVAKELEPLWSKSQHPWWSKIGQHPRPKRSVRHSFWTWLKSRWASPAGYLAYLQAREADGRNGAVGIPDDPVLQKWMDAFGKMFPDQYQEAFEIAKTATMQGAYYPLTLANKLVVDTIEKVPAAAGVLKETAVGELRLPEYNASAIRTPSGGFAIAVNMGFFLLTSEISELLFSGLGIKVVGGPDDAGSIHGTDAPLSQTEIAQYLFAALGGYLDGRNPLVAPTAIHLQTDRTRLVVSSRLAVAINFFVTAHEYGHILLGHFSAPTRRLALTGGPVTIARQDWQQEFQADHAALGLLLLRAWSDPDFGARDPNADTIDVTGLSIPMAAPFVFLMIADLLDRIRRSLHRPVAESHPPASERAKVLLLAIRDPNGPFMEMVKRAAPPGGFQPTAFLARLEQLRAGLHHVAETAWQTFEQADFVGKSMLITGINPDGTAL
jgi:hypothetical protein